MAGAMDTLDGTEWDVLISGTGLQQSLLALALSRSDKKILHIDRHDYYGGAEAALTLQDADAWVKNLEKENGSDTVFKHVSIKRAPVAEGEESKLSFSRAYSLALGPQLIYTDSKLLPALVSSRVDKQLEFQAMGHWFVYDSEGGGSLLRIPTTREDLVFSESSIDIRSKRAVMRVLRFVMDFESQQEVWEPYKDRPLSDLLSEHFKLPERLHSLFLALTLSLELPRDTSTSYALPRIARHLRSTGRIGPGFSSIIPKWGGLSEVAQIGCRAGAVGGAVYVLDNGMKSVSAGEANSDVVLSGDDKIKAIWIAGLEDDIPRQAAPEAREAKSVRRSISIVSSPLSSLFPDLAEGSPPPAGAVIAFPASSLFSASKPVYLFIHSADTGECPAGQCVIYATTSGESSLLESAVSRSLELVNETPLPEVLYCLSYEQCQSATQQPANDRTIVLPAPSLDLALDDCLLDPVRRAWERIMGDEARNFLVFEERNPMQADDEDDGF